MGSLLRLMFYHLANLLDLAREFVGVVVGVPVDYYYTRRYTTRKTKNLKKLRTMWDVPSGSIVMLHKPTTFFMNRNLGGPKEFPVGYSPMLMEIIWPEIQDYLHRQDPVVFIFWCSGKTFRYELHSNEWGGKIPFRLIGTLK